MQALLNRQSSGAAARLAAQATAPTLRSVRCQAGAGYSERPQRRSSSWEDEEEDEFTKAAAPPSQPAGQGQFRPRRQFNNEGGEGGDRQNNGYQRRSYNNGPRQYDGEGGRPRRQFDADGRPIEGGARPEKRTWQGPRQSLTPEQLAARDEANKAVQSVKSWSDISDVLASKGSVLDAENISTLFSKISSMRRPAGEADAAAYDSVLSQLLGWALNLMPQYRPKHTCRTLTALGKMQLYSPEVVTGVLEQSAQQMGNFTGFELCSMVAALGTLGQPPTEAFLLQFYERSGKKLEDGEIKLKDLSALVQGLIKLGVHTQAKPEWVQACFKALQTKAMDLPRSSSDHMKLNERPPQQAVAEGERPRRTFFKPNDSSINLTQYLDLIMAIATLARDTGVQPSQETVDALFTRQAWRVQTTEWSTVSNILWAASNLTARPGGQWFTQVDKQLSFKDQSWDAEELCTLCLYLGRYLGHSPSNMLAEKLSKFLNSDGNRALMGPEGMPAVLYFMSLSSFKPSEKWLDTIVIDINNRVVGAASTDALWYICNALPRMGQGHRLNTVVQTAQQRYIAATGIDPFTGEQVSAEPVAA